MKKKSLMVFNIIYICINRFDTKNNNIIIWQQLQTTQKN